MMKKTYISPELYMELIQAEQMIAASITSVGGNSGIGLGEPDPTSGEVPGEADAKGNFFGDAIWE